MKRVLSLLLLLVAIHLPYSCIEDDCGNFTLLESRIKAISSSIGSVEKDAFNDQVTSNFQTAAIRFEITEMEFSEIAGSSYLLQSPFIQPTFACTFPEPQLAYDITSITLIGEAAISLATDELKAGSSLNSIFEVVNHDHITLDSFSNDLASNKLLFGYIGAELILVLNEAPQEPVTQKLTLRLDFSDGTFLELKTETFEID